MKKIIYIYILLLIILLGSCNNTNIPSNNDIDENKIEKIKLIFAGNQVTPGSYLLDAVIFPEVKSQSFNFKIVGSHNGISINENVLIIKDDVKDNLIFKIVVIAKNDESIRDIIELRVLNESDGRIKIRTEDDLFSINQSLENLNQDYILMNDITLTKPWIPIGVADLENEDGSITKGTYFNGTFNGNGYSISNILIKGNLYNAGFIAQIGELGIIENVNLEGNVEVSGWSAGVAGINLGTIKNVISNINVTVSGVSAGAIAAVNKGLIQNSYAIGKIISESAENHNERSAGLVVVNDGEMIDVYGDYEKMETSNYISFNPIENTQYMLTTADMKQIKTWINFDQSIWFIKKDEYPSLINPLE